MGFVHYTKPILILKGGGRRIYFDKDGSVRFSQALRTEAFAGGKASTYDVFIDPEAKSIGLQFGDGLTYPIGKAKDPSFSAARQCLQEHGATQIKAKAFHFPVDTHPSRPMYRAVVADLWPTPKPAKGDHPAPEPSLCLHNLEPAKHIQAIRAIMRGDSITTSFGVSEQAAQSLSLWAQPYVLHADTLNAQAQKEYFGSLLGSLTRLARGAA